MSNANEFGEACGGALFHSPRPLKLHEIPVTDGKIVSLCGTCRDNLQAYMNFEESCNWSAPWQERRKFGNLIRATAQMLHAEGVSV